MPAEKSNFLKNPTKTQIILIAVFWFIGVLLLVLATTDLFRESMLQQKYLMTNLLLVGSTITFGSFLVNFFGDQRNNKSTQDTLKE